jgi:hypothetical protein
MSMFYDCIVKSPQIADQAKRILDTWEYEHTMYYARNTVRRPYGALYGFEASCGFRAIPGGGTWLTSGNNFHSITVAGSTTRITYAGRRHGMRGAFRDLLEAAARRSDYRTLTYQTEKPEWFPWETQDDRDL